MSSIMSASMPEVYGRIEGSLSRPEPELGSWSGVGRGWGRGRGRGKRLGGEDWVRRLEVNESTSINGTKQEQSDLESLYGYPESVNEDVSNVIEIEVEGDKSGAEMTPEEKRQAEGTVDVGDGSEEHKKICEDSEDNDKVPDLDTAILKNKSRDQFRSERRQDSHQQNKEKLPSEQECEVEVPPIPYISNEVLEEEDQAFIDGDFFGKDDVEPTPPKPSTEPNYGWKITKREENHYVIDMVGTGMIELPLGIQLDATLLYVDPMNVLYLRIQNPEHGVTDRRIRGTQKLLKCMKEYYSVFENQVRHVLGQDCWMPNVGEVVVVQVQRLMAAATRAGYIEQTEYHRAIVKHIRVERIGVELIDDFGVGEVQTDQVFQILEKYTALPPQMFFCELADFYLVNHREVIRPILRDTPIPNIWPDYTMVYVGMTFVGGHSIGLRPLVELQIQTCSSPTQYISLQEHIFKNIKTVLTPFILLLEENPVCDVVDFDEYGFLWVRFDEDAKLYVKMREKLGSLALLRKYYHFIDLTNFTIADNIFPAERPELHKRNKEKMYVARLSNVQNAYGTDPNSLFRVMIKSANPETNKVWVYAIDNHSLHEVDASLLLPMYNLDHDLSYLDPLVFKVHMYPLKRMDRHHHFMRESFIGTEKKRKPIKLKLVQEWPGHVYPPDVLVDNAIAPLDEKTDNDEKNISDVKFRGYAKRFINTELAEAMAPREMMALGNMIKNLAAVIEEREIKKKPKTFVAAGETKKEIDLECRTFLGDNYKFAWHADSAANSVLSVASSSSSNI